MVSDAHILGRIYTSLAFKGLRRAFLDGLIDNDDKVASRTKTLGEIRARFKP